MRTFRGADGLYHYLYKTTNHVNGRYYIGIHSTDDLDDGYLGSGRALKRAIKKYGRNNFTKQILSFHDNRSCLSQAERNIVTENIVVDPNSYNLILGGDSVIDSGGFSVGMVTVKNKFGQTFMVSKNDPRYKSGEFVFIRTGVGAYKDANGNVINTSKNDPRVISGELVGVSRGLITVHDKLTGKYISIPTSKFDETKYDLPYINLDGRKYYRWLKKDDNVISVHVSELQKYLDDGWIPGNHHKGLICITKSGKNKRINPTELQKYLDDGWVRGTNQQYNSGGTKFKGFTYVHKDGICKRVTYDDAITYLDNGWRCGMRDVKCRQYMHRHGASKLVQPTDFEDHIRSGWKFGKI